MADTSNEQRFKVTVTAVGEVRDKDGNLLNQEPVEVVFDDLSADDVRSITGEDPK